MALGTGQLEKGLFYMNQHVIGLDIGTTSTKAVIFDFKGNVVAESEVDYPLHHPHTAWVEQDPDEIQEAAVTSIRNAIQQRSIPSETITGVGISAAMHSIICVDQDGKAISPSIIWADRRSEEQAEKIKENQSDLYKRSGTPFHPMTPMAKLLWMKENQYNPYQEASRFISIKEYLLHKWFGEYVVDYSVAASSGFYNIEHQQWDLEALETIGITKDHLSTVVPASYQLKGLNRTISEAMGLQEETPFVIGGSDGPLANLGIGAINPGETAITIGTSGAIRQFSNNPIIDENQQVFCYSFTENLWIKGGPTNNGGNVLKWLKDLFTNEQSSPSFDDLTQLAAQSPAGSNRLLFLPYLNGERAPFWDSSAKGSFIGLQATHTQKDIIRAGMEGVIFSIYHIAHILEQTGDEHKALYASGGFARSSFWLQILADVFGKPVHVPKSHQSSAWGAAWVALESLGEVQNLSSIKASIPMQEPLQPNMENHEVYQDLFHIYKQVYPSLKGHLEQLNRE